VGWYGPPSSPRSCQLVARPKSRPKVETSTQPAPLQADKSDPEGQQRQSTCRSVEVRNRTWPWSVATAQAGYVLNDDDDDAFGRTNCRAVAMMFAHPSVRPSEMRMHCDQTMHFSADLSLRLGSPMSSAP